MKAFPFGVMDLDIFTFSSFTFHLRHIRLALDEQAKDQERITDISSTYPISSFQLFLDGIFADEYHIAGSAMNDFEDFVTFLSPSIVDTRKSWKLPK